MVTQKKKSEGSIIKEMRYAFRGACDDAVQQGFTSMFHALG